MCLVCRAVTALVGFVLLVVAMAYAIKQARADEAHDWHNTKFFILEQPELLAGVGGALLLVSLSSLCTYIARHARQ